MVTSRSLLPLPIGLGDELAPNATTGVLGAIRTLSTDKQSMGVMGMVLLSFLLHLLLIGLTSLIMLVMQWLGFSVPWFTPPAFKEKDIEFTLVENPEAPPRNKNTRLRSTHATRSGGEKTPNMAQAETIRAAGTKASSPSPTPQPPAAKPQPRPQPRPQPQQPKSVVTPKQTQQPRPTPRPRQQPSQAPAPRIPAPKAPRVEAPSAPSPTPPAIRFPKAPNPAPAPRPIAMGPVSSSYGPTSDSGDSGGRSGSVGPSQLPGSFSGGRSGRGTPGSMAGSGGRGSYDQTGSSGGGGGRPGVDALPAPDYGAYMAELQRRIKRNWRPPTAQEDKRVVVQFNIGRDGRLLSLNIARSSGFSEADGAALNAVRLSAPFRALPPGHREKDLPIQFTFDYNVYRGGAGGFSFR